jgi:hypothetical protein
MLSIANLIRNFDLKSFRFVPPKFWNSGQKNRSLLLRRNSDSDRNKAEFRNSICNPGWILNLHAICVKSNDVPNCGNPSTSDTSQEKKVIKSRSDHLCEYLNSLDDDDLWAGVYRVKTVPNFCSKRSTVSSWIYRKFFKLRHKLRKVR